MYRRIAVCHPHDGWRIEDGGNGEVAAYAAAGWRAVVIPSVSVDTEFDNTTNSIIIRVILGEFRYRTTIGIGLIDTPGALRIVAAQGVRQVLREWLRYEGIS